MFKFLKKIFAKNESPVTVAMNGSPSEHVIPEAAVLTAENHIPDQETRTAVRGQSAMKTTPCRTCGKPISYKPVQKHIPKYCADCRAKYKKDQQTKQGMVTITCKNCGKTETIPANVQHWPDLCQECRAKLPPQKITRKCRGCGKMFSFPATVKHWPNYCRECQQKRKKKKS